MKTQSARNGSTGMALVAGITGLLCISVLPFLIARTMTAVLQGAAVKIPASGNPLIAAAPRIVIAFFPVWGGLSIAAGVALLLVAWALYKGEAWARPAAIGLLAIPSITGAYYSGPVMYFGKSALPFFILIALIGLVPYFLLILWGKGPAGEKFSKFFVFLMLGVTAAWSFSNGGSSLRMFWARPEYYPLDASNTGFILGVPVIWAGVVTAVLSIPFLAARLKGGWRLSLVAMGIIFMGNLILFATHRSIKEFMIGIIMAIVSLALLSTPALRRNLLGKAASASPLGSSQPVAAD